MFVELVYDKRNFDGLPGAKDIILGELSKRVHRIFPDADVRVKPFTHSQVQHAVSRNSF